MPDYTADLGRDLRGVRLGLPKEYMIEGIDPQVKAAVDAALKQLQSLGAEIVDVSLPHTDYAIAVYYILATAEASANLARFDGVRYGHRAENPRDLLDHYGRTREEGFGAEVKRRIILGTYVLSSGYYDAYYLRAQKVRELIRQDFAKAFEKVDALVSPTSPVPAFKLGERTADPLQMYLADIFTNAGNLAGICGISLPCGFAKMENGTQLPIGLQLLGKALDEARILQIAHAYEQSTDWHIPFFFCDLSVFIVESIRPTQVAREQHLVAKGGRLESQQHAKKGVQWAGMPFLPRPETDSQTEKLISTSSCVFDLPRGQRRLFLEPCCRK